jgi:hypothetical protein
MRAATAVDLARQKQEQEGSNAHAEAYARSLDQYNLPPSLSQQTVALVSVLVHFTSTESAYRLTQASY